MLFPHLLALAELTRFSEYGAILSLLAIALCATPLIPALFRRLHRLSEPLANHPLLQSLIVFALGLAIAALPSLFRGIPRPYIHDEFGYLLAADTFAQGRLTNPTPPLWQHFESMHILLRPSYQSKYPPGLGLALAAGQVLFHEPIAGIWIVSALACAALHWALGAWLPWRWALLGGLLAAIHPQLIQWANRYWGGPMTVLGGALLLGGFLRLLSHPPPRPAAAIAMALGMALLANTRPYEGFVFALLCATCLLLASLRSPRPPLRLLFGRIVLPMSLVLLPVAAFMGYYNYRITGHPLRLPYQVHQAQYAVIPLFAFQKPCTTPTYNHPDLQAEYTGPQTKRYYARRTFRGVCDDAQRVLGVLYEACYDDIGRSPNPLYTGLPLLNLTGWTRTNRQIQRSIDTLKLRQRTEGHWSREDRRQLSRLVNTLRFRHYFPRHLPTLALALTLAVPVALLRDRRLRLAALLLILFFAALLLETFLMPHYAAPIAALIALITLLVLRHLYAWRLRGWPLGPFLVHAVLLTALITPACWITAFCLSRQSGFGLWRHHLEHNFFGQRDGKHLVIVRSTGQKGSKEWVHNRADLDTAKVIWAREMSPAHTAQLLRHFSDRHPWLLESDAPRPDPIPYRPPSQ